MLFFLLLTTSWAIYQQPRNGVHICNSISLSRSIDNVACDTEATCIALKSAIRALSTAEQAAFCACLAKQATTPGGDMPLAEDMMACLPARKRGRVYYTSDGGVDTSDDDASDDDSSSDDDDSDTIKLNDGKLFVH